jgi:methyl coenzyme M reductase subunit C
LKIGQSLPSTPIGGWPEDEMHKWGSYFGLVPKEEKAMNRKKVQFMVSLLEGLGALEYKKCLITVSG